jgi:hypothetical protein
MGTTNASMALRRANQSSSPRGRVRSVSAIRSACAFSATAIAWSLARK